MNKKIREELLKLQDLKYRDFQSSLIPTLKKETMIGIRIPALRKFEKTLSEDEKSGFISILPHDFYEENLLHSLIINDIKDYDECIKELNRFLPYIDNWAVSDITNPKVLYKHEDNLINNILIWVKNTDTYSIRFALFMLMNHYLDENYKKKYLLIPSKIHKDDYYINMMISWFYATALFKRYEDTIILLEHQRLDKWIHNKTIEKAIESYRITDDKKEYLKTLRIK